MTKRVILVALLLMAAVPLDGCVPAATPTAGDPALGRLNPPATSGEISDRAVPPLDHMELDKILKATPPNGPFWKYGTVIMRRKSRKAGMKPVVFAHWSHRAKYSCRVCHLDLGFSMRSGDTGITREQYLNGKYCGACHDGKIAFTVKDGPQAGCAKCHMENPGLMEAAFDKFAATMPHATFGNGIDWAKALREGKITPRNSLSAERTVMTLPDKLRQPLKLGTTSPRSDVIFSHEAHFADLDCSSCHPDIFNIKKKGTQQFSMEANLYGSYCGACHMFVSFPMSDCRRCHSSMSNYYQAR